MRVLTERVGRVAFFVHEPLAELSPPAVVQNWLSHERAVMAVLQGGLLVTTPASDWVPGEPWVLWRLLSGNNREVARGVGAYGSLTTARRAAERAMKGADEFELVNAFDPRSCHGWCLALGGEALVVSPVWHRSRRANRLNMDTARTMLGRAEVNGVATPLGGQGRTRGVVSL